MFPQNTCGELEEIITSLLDGDHSGENSGFKNEQYFLPKISYIFSEDQEMIEAGFGQLKVDFDKNELGYVYVDLRASIAIMMAYASCKLVEQQQVLYSAKEGNEYTLILTSLE